MCSRKQSVQSKIIILIFLPLNDPSVNLEECKQSLKRSIQASGEENIKANYLLSTGFDGLRNLSKKFAKNIQELCVTYYREKKGNIKRKQRRLVKEQIENVRYCLKHSLYSMLTRNDLSKSIKRAMEAYTTLKQGMISSAQKGSIEERRDNADIICLFILKMYMMAGDHQECIRLYRQHIATY